MLGMTLVTHQTGPAGARSAAFMSKTGPPSNASFISPLSWIVPLRASRFIVSTEAVWESKRWPNKTPEKIATFAVDRRAAIRRS